MKLKLLIPFVVLCFSSSMLSSQELTKELAWAIKYGQTDYLDEWISNDDINACFSTRKSKSYNVLAMSIKLNSMKSLLYFISRDADLDYACEDKTPLMYCAKYNRLEMLRVLIDRGADPKMKIRGKSALMLARSFNNHDIVKELKNLNK